MCICICIIDKYIYIYTYILINIYIYNPHIYIYISLPCFPALTKFPWLWQQMEKKLTDSRRAAEAAKQEDLKID